MSALQAHDPPQGRPPRQVREDLWLFAPNRDTQGGSAWWLACGSGGVLIDVPAFQQANLDFLKARGAGCIVLTGRDGHGRVRRFQEALGWPVHVQEQEAYLLPGLRDLHPFGATLALEPGLSGLWTPGPTPGAAVLLASTHQAGGSLLFCGRLLSPMAPGMLAPLRTRRSFHWHRWLRSLEQLRAWLPPQAPEALASGAGLGALRGEHLVPSGRAVLETLDLAALAHQPPV
jgi:glyoxylase-like metal-dependent hydrolase (beta-lactamase superfamily II)